MKLWCPVILLLVFASRLMAQIGTLEPSLTMVSVDGTMMPMQHGVPVPSFEQQPRTLLNLAGKWKKLRFAADHNLSLTKRDSAGRAALMTEAGGKTSPWFVDSAWQSHNVPGVENILGAFEKTPEFYSDGVFYRRTFTVADSLQSKTALLKFLAVNYIADVWLNGTYLGWHEGGYTPFAFDISGALRYDSANVLVVRVDNVPWGTRKDIVPYYPSDWFNYTGIIHDVGIEFCHPVSVVRADVVPKNISGLMQASVLFRNDLDTAANVQVKFRLFRAKLDSTLLDNVVTADLVGEEVAVDGSTSHELIIPPDSIKAVSIQFTVTNPMLWSPKKPNLYILKISVTRQGVTTDEFYTQFGIRTIKTVGDKIFLNEKPVFLHGVARHEDHPQYGRSLPTSVIYNDLLAVKSVNANYLRTGHYPNHPFTYLAADRLGLMVMEEIPVWWFDETLPWLIQNSVRKIHHQMFREMVFRDFNRPSIVLWSTSNECKDVSGRSAFIQTVRAELEAQYADGRLITQSAAADRPGPNDESQSYCDVAGWTMYFGIFYNPSGLGMYRGTKYFLVDAHDFFPKKPIIATEYGYWSREDMSQLTEQVQTFDSTFLAFQPRLPIEKNGTYNPAGFLAGITWWCIFDWYTHQQTGGYQSMGLIRMGRTEAKPVKTALSSMYKQYAANSEYITKIEKTLPASLPKAYALGQNHPNPFNPATTISFSLPIAGIVHITLFDVLGKKVTDLVHEEFAAGTYTKLVDAAQFASGVYFYQMRSGKFTDTKKMILVR